MKYESDGIWVSRAVERGRNYISKPVLAGFFTIGWIPMVLTILVFLPNWREMTLYFKISQFLAALMVMLGPWDVWYYNNHIYTRFFERIDDVIPPEQESDISNIAKRYNYLFSEKYWITVLPWMLLVVFVFSISEPYLQSQGISNPASIDYIAYFLFFLYWAFFTGLGFHGGLVAILCIKSISESIEFKINPYHPDNSGGFTAIGFYAVRTSLLISTGSLAIPLSLDIATTIGTNEPVYLGIACFMLILATVFIYPTFKINQHAQSARREILKEYRSRLHELREEISKEAEQNEGSDIKELSLQFEYQRVRQEYEDYRKVKLYPISYSILSQLLSSVFLPVVVLLLEMTITSMI